jgi:hypothetical protein
MLRPAILALPLFAAAWLAACVGDDPGTGTPPNDAGGGGDSTISPDAPDNTNDGGGTSDAPVDATPPPRCDRTKPFGTPAKVAWTVAPAADVWGRLTSDEKTMVLSCVPTGTDASSPAKLCISERTSTSDPFSSPSPLSGALNAVSGSFPAISDDRKTIVYEVDVAPGDGRLFRASRSSPTDDFGPGTELTALRAGFDSIIGAYLLPDGLTLYFDTEKDNNTVFTNQRSTRVASGEFGSFSPVASGLGGGNIVVSADERVAYSLQGIAEIRRFHRSTPSDAWTQDGLVTELNSPQQDVPTWASPDDCVVYLWSLRDGPTPHLYWAERGK